MSWYNYVSMNPMHLLGVEFGKSDLTSTCAYRAATPDGEELRKLVKALAQHDNKNKQVSGKNKLKEYFA